MYLTVRRRNEDNRKEMGVLCITDQLRKVRLSWFGGCGGSRNGGVVAGEDPRTERSCMLFC